MLLECLFSGEFVLEQLLLLGLPLPAFLRLLLHERLLLFAAQKGLLLGLLLQGQLLLLPGCQLPLQFFHLGRRLPHLLLLLILGDLSFFLYPQKILRVLLRTFSVQLLQLLIVSGGLLQFGFCVPLLEFCIHELHHQLLDLLFLPSRLLAPSTGRTLRRLSSLRSRLLLRRCLLFLKLVVGLLLGIQGLLALPQFLLRN